MKKCIAVYLRLSLEDMDKRTNQAKDESNSIAAQRQLIQRYIAMNPYLSGLPQIEFRDDGFSGTNFRRPDFQRMIDLIRDGKIQIVIVKDLSRFGRDYLEVGDYLEHIFPFLGVRMISINDHYDSEQNLGNTAGMDVAFRNLIYDYYSKDLSKKVKTAMQVKQREGGYVSCCLYGYRVLPQEKHKMVIDPETAPIVRRVFEEIIAGKSSSQVARELNAEGVPTPLEYKGVRRKNQSDKKPLWTHQRILEMLRNIKYTGCMVNHTRESRKIRDKAQYRVPKEEWIIHENAHEAIVSMEEFEAAKDALRKVRPHKKKTERDVYPFYCAHCGRKLQKTFGNDVHFYCATPYWNEEEYSCKEVRWDRTKIEEVVLEALKAQIAMMSVQSRGKSKAVQSKDTVLRQKMKILTGELKSGDSQKVQSYLDYREGRITKEDFIALRAQCEQRAKELQEEIARTEAEYQEYLDAEEQVKKERAITRKTDSLDEESLRKIMYDAVERVNFVDGQNIEIVWKFDDLFHTA